MKKVYINDFNKTKKYYWKHLSELGIQYIPECVNRDNNLMFFLVKHDTNQDQEMAGLNKENEEQVTKQMLQNIKPKRYYAQYIDDVYEFGLFSDDFIQKGEILGQITGELSLKLRGENYQVLYPSKYNGNQDIWIDSSQESNMFRFLNDNHLDSNVEIKHRPYQNQWITLVFAIQDIQIGEQLTSDYGDEFWQNRKRGQKITNHLYQYFNPFNQTSFNHQDFDKFQIQYIKQPNIHNDLIPILYDFNIKESREYQKDQDIIQTIFEEIGNQLYDLPEMDDFLEIKFVNQDIGFGLFATKHIPANTVLGEYTGTLSLDIGDSTYSWSLTNYYDKDIQIYLNGAKEGNMLRFINDYGVNNNVHAQILPLEDRWAIFYVTLYDIEIGEELGVSYGEDYWNDRYRDIDNSDEPVYDFDINEL